MPGVTLEFYQVQGGKYRFLFERKEGSQDDATGTAQYYGPCERAVDHPRAV